MPTPNGGALSYRASASPGNQVHVDGSALIASNTAPGGAGSGAT